MAKRQLTEEDGERALHQHLEARAAEARRRYGPGLGPAALQRMIEDREIVRFPVHLEFDAAPLIDGEFAFPEPLGDSPKDGFRLCVHPHFQDRPEVLALLVGYHIPSINYLDIAGREEAEQFGATLNGMEVEAYYQKLCQLADELSGG